MDPRALTRPLLTLLTTTSLLAGGLAVSATAAEAAPIRASAVATAGTWTHARAVPRAARPVLLVPRGARGAVPAAVPPAPAVSPTSAYAAEVLRLVNVERTARGLRAVRADDCATRYATRQNDLIAAVGALSHQLLGAVLTGCGARGVGENVAYGNVTAAQMMTMWMNSPGHRANILNASFTHLGVGAKSTSGGRWYGTQVFLRR